MRGLVPAITAVGARAGIGFRGTVRAIVRKSPRRCLQELAVYRAMYPPQPRLPVIRSRNQRAHGQREQRRRRNRLVPGIQDYNLRANEHENLWETSKPPVEALYAALRVGTSHAVLRCLIRLTLAMDEEELIRLWKKIPPTTFSEILRCLDPDHFLGEYQDKYRGITPQDAKLLGIPASSYPTYHQFSQQFLQEIMHIISARMQVTALTLADYSYLLKCARATGNLEAATSIWAHLQAGDNEAKPNVECYNHYLGVKCWSETTHPGSVYSGRVIERNSAPRKWGVPPVWSQGHRTSPRPGIIKKEILALFQEMVSSGLSGDETTFCYMMVTFARTRDMLGIEAILKRVWGVDVQALLISENLEPPAKKYSPDSPLHPTAQLLFTIAHAYGMNNEIPTALRLLDYVSRQYSIALDHDVAMELMGWTYTLSHNHGHTKRWLWNTQQVNPGGPFPIAPEDFTVTFLPKIAVANLYYTIIAEPYNIKPTIELLELPIHASISSGILTRDESLERAQELMKAGRYCARLDVYRLGQLHRDIKSVFHKNKRHPALQGMTQALHLQQLKVRHNRLVIRYWVDRLLKIESVPRQSISDWRSSPSWPLWYGISVPNIVREWDTYLKDTVTYATATGFVTIHTESSKLNALKLWNIRYGEKSRALRMRRAPAGPLKAVNPSAQQQSQLTPRIWRYNALNKAPGPSFKGSFHRHKLKRARNRFQKLQSQPKPLWSKRMWAKLRSFVE
jgi:hypothetical protein